MRNIKNITMKNLKFTAFVLSVCMLASSCSMNNTGKGALIGAGGGAAVGTLVGTLAASNKGKGAGIGAAVGTAVGAGVGALIGRKMDKAKAAAEAVENAQVESVTDANGLQAVKVTFESGILFSTSSASLSSSATASLAKFASTVSKQRAEAVSNYLKQCGVSASQIASVEGLGEANPVADNSTAAGQEQNRRVEVYLYASEEMIKSAEAEAGNQYLKRFMKRIRKILQWIVLLFFGSTILFVILYRFVPVPLTPLMIIRCAQQASRGEKIRMHHQWVPLKDISQYLPVAVMASEDQRFLQHHGFDFIEIQNAVEERLSGKRQRGGSTISQQTAKNVFLWPNSTWLRKGLEFYFTILIELFWSKERIMEVYLNSIEMGDGIYGAEAVAQINFNRSAKKLTRANCALIAATLPNPLKFSSKDPSRYILKRQTAIMLQMKHIDLLDCYKHP